MEEGRQRFTILNHCHLKNNYDTSQDSRKILNFNPRCFSKSTQIYNNNDEIKTEDYFGNQAFFISNGS
jgi:hypothetical protein